MDNGENNDINEPGTSGYCSPATTEVFLDVPRPKYRHGNGVYYFQPEPLFENMGNDIEDSSPPIPLARQSQLFTNMGNDIEDSSTPIPLACQSQLRPDNIRDISFEKANCQVILKKKRKNRI